MRIKEQWQIDQFIRAAKALGGPVLTIRFPLAMADPREYPGADRWQLASVYCYDGKALVRTSTLRCGLLLCDWSKLMRFIRRHNLAYVRYRTGPLV